MRAWQTALTLLGWLAVILLVTLNLRLLAPTTYVVVAIFAVGTAALLKTPPFPSRSIALAVSWVGSLLVIVSEVYAFPNHRMEFTTSSAVIQVVSFAVVMGWVFTYGLLPIIALVRMISPRRLCRVFEGTEQVPWRYWWVPTLAMTALKSATVWYAWSIVNYAEKQIGG